MLSKRKLAPPLVASAVFFCLLNGSGASIAQRYAPSVPRPEQSPIIIVQPSDIIKRASPAPIISASSVPWAASVYQPASDASDYGKRSLANIDAYLASQCSRSGNSQYYCTNKPLTATQLDWINRVTGVQMQQTHYRCGSNSWCIR